MTGPLSPAFPVPGDAISSAGTIAGDDHGRKPRSYGPGARLPVGAKPFGAVDGLPDGTGGGVEVAIFTGFAVALMRREEPDTTAIGAGARLGDKLVEPGEPGDEDFAFLSPPAAALAAPFAAAGASSSGEGVPKNSVGSDCAPVASASSVVGIVASSSITLPFALPRASTGTEVVAVDGPDPRTPFAVSPSFFCNFSIACAISAGAGAADTGPAPPARVDGTGGGVAPLDVDAPVVGSAGTGVARGAAFDSVTRPFFGSEERDASFVTDARDAPPATLAPVPADRRIPVVVPMGGVVRTDAPGRVDWLGRAGRLPAADVLEAAPDGDGRAPPAGAPGAGAPATGSIGTSSSSIGSGGVSLAAPDGASFPVGDADEVGEVGEVGDADEADCELEAAAFSLAFPTRDGSGTFGWREATARGARGGTDDVWDAARDSAREALLPPSLSEPEVSGEADFGVSGSAIANTREFYSQHETRQVVLSTSVRIRLHELAVALRKHLEYEREARRRVGGRLTRP